MENFLLRFFFQPKSFREITFDFNIVNSIQNLLLFLQFFSWCRLFLSFPILILTFFFSFVSNSSCIFCNTVLAARLSTHCLEVNSSAATSFFCYNCPIEASFILTSALFTKQALFEFISDKASSCIGCLTSATASPNGKSQTSNILPDCRIKMQAKPTLFIIKAK